VNCYPFIEAEKAQQRNVKRACELLRSPRRLLRRPRGPALQPGPRRRGADRADHGRAQAVPGPV
jgi:hypothetical protein